MIKLAVVGAAGRMGQSLIRAVHDTKGVELSAALEHSQSEAISSDSGLLAGIGSNGIMISHDLEQAFT